MKSYMHTGHLDPNMTDAHQRKGRIGSSQVGAIAGFGGYVTLRDVWADYTGSSREEFDDGARDSLWFGSHLESHIAGLAQDWIRERLGEDIPDIETIPGAYVDDEHPYLMLHPDRQLSFPSHGKKIGIEIKTASSQAVRKGLWGEQDSDIVPDQYRAQCFWYMTLGDYDEVWLIRFTDNRLTRYIIHPNEGYQKVLYLAAVMFHDKVEGGWVPPATRPDQNQILWRGDGTTVTANRTAMWLAGVYKSLSDDISALTEKRDKTAIRIQEYMKDAEFLTDTDDNKVMTWRKTTSKRLDSKRLKTEQPVTYEQYSVESQSRRLLCCLKTEKEETGSPDARSRKH